jgi:general secretion pathway protein G
MTHPITQAIKEHRRTQQSGFTLLEMLVVMVIIGLLAGLVGPRIFGKVDNNQNIYLIAIQII